MAPPFQGWLLFRLLSWRKLLCQSQMRIIFKCPHIKGGTGKASAHLENYVSYVATREGVQKVPENKTNLPATKKQRQIIAQLIRDFPLSKGLFEYDDFQSAPTQGNASEFIARALEDNLDQVAKKENYLEYIAQRPRAQKVGVHGLFSSSDEPVILSRVADTVAHHPGTVWLHIISLRREDAARLGYDNAEQWKTLLTSYTADMARAMKIPVEDFRWYAAFHDEGHHPHIHMVCYSTDGKSGYLSKAGIAEIKSGLAKTIFRQELTEIYKKQTQRRDSLAEDAGDVLKNLIGQMQSGTLENEYIARLMLQLAQKLKNTSGKKQYGYLKVPLKNIVDEIVDQLAKDPRIVEAYGLWYELREDVLRTYRDDLPERLPLSKQKEFKKIKNLVIQEAVKLGDLTVPLVQQVQESDGSVHDVIREEARREFLLQSVTRLLHHMSRIFQEQAPAPGKGIRFTDKKLRQKIREKKMAQGHKADDHEPEMSM